MSPREQGEAITAALPELRDAISRLAGEACVGTQGTVTPDRDIIIEAIAEITGCLTVIEKTAEALASDGAS